MTQGVEYFPFKEGALEREIDKYKTQKLKAEFIGNFPSSYQLKGIPWISYIKAYCESATLQMIAYKYGMKESINYFNFLLGFTYGHFYCPNSKVLFPFTDPEIGFDIASRYIGLERKFFITDKVETFLKALRFCLSMNTPIRVSLDWGILAKQNRFLPHSILIVGYDEAGFYYYETTQKDRFIEGTKGLKLTDEYLIESVSKVSERFSYPWKYAFTTFERSIEKYETNLSKLWKRNGELLMGKEYVPKSKKSLAEIFISEIKATSDLRPIKWKLKFAFYSREDNSRFLREYFPDIDIKETGKLFKEASEFYKKTLEFLEAGKTQSKHIFDFLDNAESLEKKIGSIFMIKGEKSIYNIL